MIDYKKTDGPSWVEQVKEITQGRGVDVVFDSVGKDTWEGSLSAIKRKGKVMFPFFLWTNLPFPHPQKTNKPTRSYTSAPRPAQCRPSPSRSWRPTTRASCAAR